MFVCKKNNPETVPDFCLNWTKLSRSALEERFRLVAAAAPESRQPKYGNLFTSIDCSVWFHHYSPCSPRLFLEMSSVHARLGVWLLFLQNWFSCNSRCGCCGDCRCEWSLWCFSKTREIETRMYLRKKTLFCSLWTEMCQCPRQKTQTKHQLLLPSSWRQLLSFLYQSTCRRIDRIRFDHK